jgi:hypothetical protein
MKKKKFCMLNNLFTACDAGPREELDSPGESFLLLLLLLCDWGLPPQVCEKKRTLNQKKKKTENSALSPRQKKRRNFFWRGVEPRPTDATVCDQKSVGSKKSEKNTTRVGGRVYLKSESTIGASSTMVVSTAIQTPSF